MPNHVANRLLILGDGVQEFAATMNKPDRSGEVSEFSFHHTVPVPDDVFQGNLSMEKQVESKGRNWYDWNCANWGTKWDTYDVKTTRSSATGYLRINIWFDTAWSPPLAWLEKASAAFPKLSFRLYFSDNGMPFHGKAIFKNGKCIKSFNSRSDKLRKSFRNTHKLHSCG